MSGDNKVGLSGAVNKPNPFSDVFNGIDPSSIDFLNSLGSDPRYQLEQVLRDGTISLAELFEYPALVHHIEVTLGYGSVITFIETHANTNNQSIIVRNGGKIDENATAAQEVTLYPASLDAIRASISGSVAPTEPYVADPITEDLPTDIDPESTFVVFTLPDGKKITFDGPEAGKIANEFATIYNNSETFRTTITELAQAQGGQYSFHSLPLDFSATGITLGVNIAGVGEDNPVLNSGVFIQSLDLQDFSLAGVIIHEVAHDVLPESPHSREQTVFQSTIINELSQNKIDIHYDVDGDDYNHDALVFNTEFDSRSDEPSGSVTSVNSAGRPTTELANYKKTYKEVASLIEQGNYAGAAELLSTIPADATINLAFEEPQRGEVTTVTYNVRELFFQDLLLSADSADRFDTAGSNDQDKENLAGFLNYLTSSGSDLAVAVQPAADGINFDLAGELPDYSRTA